MTHTVKHLFEDDPVIMGVVNVTPDSFSDGGKYINKNNAVEHGITLLQEGATILDIGGESTRPGSQIVDIQEEIDRVVPVIKELSKHAPYISIDTRNAATMRAALDAGANAINDISALTHDSESVVIAKKAQVPVFLMHMQGTPQIMQKKPIYNNVVEDVYQYLKDRKTHCETLGIDKENIILDIGIGFGKTLEDNLLLLRNISKFHDLHCPLLLGTSRKSFIGALDNNATAEERLPGSLSSIIWGRSQGVQMFRVHDVKESVQALKIYDAIAGA
ncbi:MAG: dihydropteroate synthase [Alphaproteobacteria bacterium]